MRIKTIKRKDTNIYTKFFLYNWKKKKKLTKARERSTTLTPPKALKKYNFQLYE